MSLHHQILRGAYYPFKAIKSAGQAMGLVSKNSLRVLHYHDIAPEEYASLAAQLRWLNQSWTFVSPLQFSALISGDEPILGRKLLLTFDDGYASSRRVAEQVLKPMGIRALFFVVSDLLSLVDREEARQFIARHFEIVRSADELPVYAHNMVWTDLEALMEQGHCIGAHTRSHARLSRIDSEAELEREIVSSADTLAERLGVGIQHFAYTFGDVDSFSARALAIARRRFRFIYSGLRGDNARGVSRLALRRDAVTARDPLPLLGAYLEGAADAHYAASRAQLDAWV